MIFDWRNVPLGLGGEWEDALGNTLLHPKRTVRLDSDTGEVWALIIPFEFDPNTGRVKLERLQFVPPITVWLYL